MEQEKENKLPVVVYQKLGKAIPSHKQDCRTPFGKWVEGDPCRILIDPRQDRREMLDTIIHEVLHEALKETTEEGVVRISALVSEILWREGYRQIEDLNPRNYKKINSDNGQKRKNRRIAGKR